VIAPKGMTSTCVVSTATRPLRAVQQHTKRAYKGNLAVGVVPERGGGGRAKTLPKGFRRGLKMSPIELVKEMPAARDR
jgi:hypothetical protein